MMLKTGTATARKHKVKLQPTALVVTAAFPAKACHCNRCGRNLIREDSVLRGIGPVCARRALKTQQRLTDAISTEEYDVIGVSFQGIVNALALEKLVLPHETEYRAALKTAANRVVALGASYEILGLICNEIFNLMPTDVRTAFAVENLFQTLGNPEEGEKARKRIVKVASLDL